MLYYILCYVKLYYVMLCYIEKRVSMYLHLDRREVKCEFDECVKKTGTAPGPQARRQANRESVARSFSTQTTPGGKRCIS